MVFGFFGRTNSTSLRTSGTYSTPIKQEKVDEAGESQVLKRVKLHSELPEFFHPSRRIEPVFACEKWTPLLSVNDWQGSEKRVGVQSKDRSCKYSMWLEGADNKMIFPARLHATTATTEQLKDYPAHAVTIDLITHSDYLCRVTKESGSLELDRLKVDTGITQEQLHCLVGSIYSKELILRPSNIEAILRTATFLEMTHLVDACCRYIKETILQREPVQVFKLGEQLPGTGLQAAAEQHLLTRLWRKNCLEPLVELLRDVLDVERGKVFVQQCQRECLSQLQVVGVIWQVQAKRVSLLQSLDFSLFHSLELQALVRVASASAGAGPCSIAGGQARDSHQAAQLRLKRTRSQVLEGNAADKRSSSQTLAGGSGTGRLRRLVPSQHGSLSSATPQDDGVISISDGLAKSEELVDLTQSDISEPIVPRPRRGKGKARAGAGIRRGVEVGNGRGRAVRDVEEVPDRVGLKEEVVESPGHNCAEHTCGRNGGGPRAGQGRNGPILIGDGSGGGDEERAGREGGSGDDCMEVQDVEQTNGLPERCSVCDQNRGEGQDQSEFLVQVLARAGTYLLDAQRLRPSASTYWWTVALDSAAPRLSDVFNRAGAKFQLQVVAGDDSRTSGCQGRSLWVAIIEHVKGSSTEEPDLHQRGITGFVLCHHNAGRLLHWYGHVWQPIKQDNGCVWRYDDAQGSWVAGVAGWVMDEDDIKPLTYTREGSTYVTVGVHIE